jgi:hypothetical protein
MCKLMNMAAVVLSLVVAGGAEARGGHGHGGHGGHGHRGHRPRAHHRRPGRAHHRHPGHRHRGYLARGGRRAGWAVRYGAWVRRGWFPGTFSWPTRVWSEPYGCYTYTGPGLGGYYYLDQNDDRYYPISRLKAGDAAANSDAVVND